MKKILLIIVLLISGLGLNAQSVIIDDLEFTVTSETPAECEVSGYSGKPVDVTIPSTVTISGKEFAVTSIGYEAFSDCSSLTSIEIPSGVTSIGNSAFYNCSSLTSIEIPSGVTSIGDWAFDGCSSLTIIDFGENSQLTSIGESAFERCTSLTSIEIPSGVTSIGDWAFNECSSLTSIIVESGNTVYDSRDNCNAIIETATNTLIAGCQNTVIPNTVTSIGEAAFSWCSSLTSIEIPSGVTSIGEWAFSSCSSLTSIYCYAETVPETGSSAFISCNLKMVIYVPIQSVDTYETTVPWNNYTIMPLSYIVAATANPEDAGVITGTGEYELSDTVTLTATANEGYKFINWTENDSVVSEVAEYTFVVESDRNLVANFEEIEQPTDSLVLSAPALAVDTVTETTIVLVWNAIDSATSYNVYMDSVLVKNVTDTVCTVDSLTAETTYSFTVKAIADTLESEFSNTVTVTTLKAEGEEPEQPENPEEPGENPEEPGENPEEPGDEPEEPIELDTPENVKATAISTSSIIITWDKVENALSYNIYRDGELLDDTENTNYTDENLEYDTEYCYTIEAVNGKETSDESEEVCVKTLGEGVEEHETSFNIYPNPVSDKLYIETQTQTQTVEIYDIYGRRQSMVNGQQSTVIDVSDLNSGVYFVKVVTSEGEAVKRFIKK